MKRILLIIVVVTFLFSGYSFADDTVKGADPAYVTTVTLMGELWANANRGGFLFYTDNLPDEINYFIVRGESELYVNRLLAALLSAKSMNKRVAVSYIQFETGEGDVVAISIE